jgi:hypothetical protein
MRLTPRDQLPAEERVDLGITTEVYLLRQTSGDSEDFWPLSAHRTEDGAIARLREKAEELGLEVRPYGPNDGPCGPEGYSDRVEGFSDYHGGSHLFVHELTLED